MLSFDLENFLILVKGLSYLYGLFGQDANEMRKALDFAKQQWAKMPEPMDQDELD